jgi:hypothetical protein
MPESILAGHGGYLETETTSLRLFGGSKDVTVISDPAHGSGRAFAIDFDRQRRRALAEIGHFHDWGSSTLTYQCRSYFVSSFVRQCPCSPASKHDSQTLRLLSASNQCAYLYNHSTLRSEALQERWDFPDSSDAEDSACHVAKHRQPCRGKAGLPSD